MTDDARQFNAGLAKFAETVDALAVDAIKAFAGKASQKLVDYSPIARRPFPNRGLFLANWRASLRFRDDERERRPDPVGVQTVASMVRVVESGPTRLPGWGEIHLSNPHKDAEQIEQRRGIVARTARELQDEARR